MLGQAESWGGKAAGRHAISSKGYIYSQADEIRATSREGDTQKPVGAKVKHQMNPVLVFLSVQTPWEGCRLLGRQVAPWAALCEPTASEARKGARHLSGSCRSSAPCRIRTFDRSGVFSLTFIQICLVLLTMPK